MKLVQKILSHGLLIAFFVAAFFIYMNRVELFPQWFAKSPVPASADRSQTKTERPATATTPVSRPDTVVSEPGAVVLKQDVATAKPAVVTAEPADETPPVLTPGDNTPQASTEDVQPGDVQQDSAKNNAEPVFRPLTEKDPVEVAAAGSGNEAEPQPAEVVSAPLEEAGETVEQAVTTGQAAAGPDTAEASDFQARLEQARAYFWQRDIRAALQAYRGLAESYPERAEVWGELGNLYFNIRRTSEAMDSYAQAVKLLTEQGDAERARALLDVMYRLDARRASQFEMRLRQTGG
jgi:tetratricopeptide (TPR) repeat protein